MTLLRLAPAIRARVLAMPPEAFSERELRRVAMISKAEEQSAPFEAIPAVSSEKPAA